MGPAARAVACSCLQVESGRYHVYVGNACPWCHRVVLTIILRGLTQHISITNAVDDAERASRGGWVFDTPDPVFGKNDLRQVCLSLLNCWLASLAFCCMIFGMSRASEESRIVEGLHWKWAAQILPWAPAPSP